MAAERLFLDTNILLTATVPERSKHTTILHAFNSDWPASGTSLYTCGQNIREYLVVATRPTEVNGLGLDISAALHNVESFSTRMHVLGESAETSQKLRNLLERYQIHGKRIHDANLVAVMLTNGIETVVTQNPRDFRNFTDLINVVEM